jgi:vacuolar iron transporter family protein
MFFKINQDYLRSAVFGFQDALVSTTGIVIGISAGTNQKEFILLSALVTISVEALSMGVGQYLSEKTVHNLPQNRHQDNLLIGGLIMFISYLLGGIVPVIPIFFLNSSFNSILSIIFAFIGLFSLGFFKAKLFQGQVWRSAIEMLVIGGLATILGLIVGLIFKI